jgi:hypothetical protein
MAKWDENSLGDVDNYFPELASREEAAAPAHGDEPPPVNGEADYGLPADGATARAGDEAPPRLQVAPARLVTPLQWPNEPPPPIDWLAAQRIPRGDVTTLHGDGGAGKTDVALQLAANCARRSAYWLQRVPVIVVHSQHA